MGSWNAHSIQMTHFTLFIPNSSQIIYTPLSNTTFSLSPLPKFLLLLIQQTFLRQELGRAKKSSENNELDIVLLMIM